jgi:peptidoglycan hydrolase CwlO-like protein
MTLQQIVLILAQASPNQAESIPVFLQTIGVVGGLLGIVALVSLPWTIKKIRTETRSLEISTERSGSDLAVKHLEAALDEADRQISRFQTQVSDLNAQIVKLQQMLEEERAKSAKERELHEQRILQLLVDLRTRDSEIAQLRRGGNSGTAG